MFILNNEQLSQYDNNIQILKNLKTVCKMQAVFKLIKSIDITFRNRIKYYFQKINVLILVYCSNGFLPSQE